MDRQIIEGMLGDALEREIITAKMVDGRILPPSQSGSLTAAAARSASGMGKAS